MTNKRASPVVTRKTVALEGSRLAPEGGCRTGIVRDKKLTAIGRDPASSMDG